MYKRKLYFFGLFSTFILLVALASASITAHLTRENLTQSQLAQNLLSEHQKLSSISYRLFKQLTDELIFGVDANQAKVRNKQQRISEILSRIKRLELEQRNALGLEATQGSVEDTDELELLINEIIKEFGVISQSNDVTPLREQQRLQTLLENTIDNQFRELINSAINRQTQVVSSINASIDTLNTTIVWFTILLGVITLPFILLGCYWLFNALYQPLNVIKAGTDAIASGNYDYRLPETLDSEFTDLVRAMNAMVSRLAEHELQAEAHRKQLEYEVETRTRALTAANGRLTDLDTRRRQFMADVSHELRTPLTIIRGEAQVTLRQSSQEEAVYKETLQTILDQAVNLSKLVDDLLLLARAEMHEFTLEISQCELRPIITRQLQLWEKMSPQRAFSIQWNADENLCILVDKDRFMQALTILLENANKYSPPSGTITIAVSVENKWATISVIDEGDGISPSDIEHIFERFVRLKRNTEGMGLGLSIARAIIDAHNGKLWAESTLGEGSTFSLSFPVDE